MPKQSPNFQGPLRAERILNYTGVSATSTFYSKTIQKIVYVDDTPASEIFDVYVIGGLYAAADTVALVGTGLESAAVPFDATVGLTVDSVSGDIVVRVAAVPIDGYVAGDVISFTDSGDAPQLVRQENTGGDFFSLEVFAPKYIQIDFAAAGNGDSVEVWSRVSGAAGFAIAASIDDTAKNNIVSFVDGALNSVMVMVNAGPTSGLKIYAQW